MSALEVTPWLHVYEQRRNHGPARITATRQGLIALREAVNRALADGAAECELFASDGEGYGLTIHRRPGPSHLGRLPYARQDED